MLVALPRVPFTAKKLIENLQNARIRSQAGDVGLERVRSRVSRRLRGSSEAGEKNDLESQERNGEGEGGGGLLSFPQLLLQLGRDGGLQRLLRLLVQPPQPQPRRRCRRLQRFQHVLLPLSPILGARLNTADETGRQGQ